MHENYFANTGYYLSQLQNVIRVFSAGGYSPAIIPMLDEHKPYEVVEEALDKDAFKILDRQGNLLLVRSDTTLFLAKAIASHLGMSHSVNSRGKIAHSESIPLPLRLFYSNSVIRPASSYTETELFQTGIELIGLAGIASDFEIIHMLDTALSQIALPPLHIHVGSRTVVDALIGDGTNGLHAYNTQTNARIYNALGERNLSELSRLVGRQCATAMLSIQNASDVSSFTAMLTKILSKTRANGTAKRRGTISARDAAAVKQYHALIDGLSQCLGTEKILCDLSEVGNHTYYTGTTFSIYSEGIPSAIAQGGRYDKLMEQFGVSASAVGGTIFPHLFFEHIVRSAPHVTRDTGKTATQSRSKGTARSVSMPTLISRAREFRTRHGMS